MNSPNFSVAQKDFELCKESSLKDVYKDKSFTDITLACNDVKKNDSQRIILSSKSLFFMRILKANDKKDILIYLQNVSSGELATILEFVYLGQTWESLLIWERFLKLKVL